MWKDREKEQAAYRHGRRKGRTEEKRTDTRCEVRNKKGRNCENERGGENKSLCMGARIVPYAGEDEAFLERFFEMLTVSEGVSKEFLYYLEHENFLCEYQVAGYSLVDIMVWQMDHFKAQLDRDREGMKSNGDQMLLEAFHTMLLMERDPQYYVNLMQTETGTDYVGKYL